MRRAASGYFQATQHPWPCLWFLLPPLTAYEAGVLWLGGTQPEALRNGADTWLRWGLDALGIHQLYCAPALIVVVFLGWSLLRRGDRPEHPGRTWLGMWFESALFALGLWGLSRVLGPMLDSLGVRLQWGPPAAALQPVITFVGAGIYEEVLFRLLLIFVVGCLLKVAEVPAVLVTPLVTVASGLLFSAAHHIGPYGEPFDGYVFLFRALAGLYFALLYQVRGFGIAVGAHVGYDVLVGVVLA
jgi:hypothetical protein